MIVFWCQIGFLCKEIDAQIEINNLTEIEKNSIELCRLKLTTQHKLKQNKR